MFAEQITSQCGMIIRPAWWSVRKCCDLFSWPITTYSNCQAKLLLWLWDLVWERYHSTIVHSRSLERPQLHYDFFHQTSLNLHPQIFINPASTCSVIFHHMMVSMWYDIPSWQPKWTESDGSPRWTDYHITPVWQSPRTLGRTYSRVHQTKAECTLESGCCVL